MIKIYKNCGEGGNGEFVIVTDEKTVNDFCWELSRAIETSIDNFLGDVEFTIHGILVNAIPICFKLAGYKAEGVHEIKELVSGYSSPSECTLVYDNEAERRSKELSQTKEAGEWIKSGQADKDIEEFTRKNNGVKVEHEG